MSIKVRAEYGQPIWDSVYTGRHAYGRKEVRNLELIVPVRYSEGTSGRLFAGVEVYPDGTLFIPGWGAIQCASVDEAKEIGMSTYLLTQEGG